MFSATILFLPKKRDLPVDLYFFAVLSDGIPEWTYQRRGQFLESRISRQFKLSKFPVAK